MDEEVPFDLLHRGVLIGRYRADTIADRRVIVEVKTGLFPDPIAPGQLLNYLGAAHIGVGLVLDFCPAGVKVKRMVATGRGTTKRYKAQDRGGTRPE